MIERLPSRLLRLEGLAVLVGAVVLYFDAGFGWLLLLLLVLARDLSAVGYLAGQTVGAAGYDLVHTYVLPMGLTVVGVLVDREMATQIALIWFAHIARTASSATGSSTRRDSRTRTSSACSN